MKNPFKLDQEITFDREGREMVGVLVAYREDKKNRRWRLTVRDADGRFHMLWSQAGDSCFVAGFQGWAVDLAQDEQLARAHLNGQRVPMGVEEICNRLAAALLQSLGATP